MSETTSTEPAIEPPAREHTSPQAVRHMVPRVMEAIRTESWAITEDFMATICAIASRENEVSIEALEAMAARRVSGTFDLRIRDGVAIMSVNGPIMKHADMFAMISGATSYEGIRRDLETAKRDASVRAVLISIDSPGGMVNGCAECADAIREVGAVKPVEAYVSGAACSAAYWIATACNKITLNRTSDVGSIGVVQSVRDTSEIDARRGIKTTEFVSSRAPNKRVAYDTDEGRAKVMRYVDTLEEVFIQAIASNRGVTAEHVAVNFGGGGVEVGADAVQLGMADALGSFEEVFERLKSGKGQTARSKGNTDMSNTPATFSQADIDAAVAKARNETANASADQVNTAAATAAAATQTRIKAIMDSDDAKTRPAMAKHLAFNTTLATDEALNMLKVAAEEKPSTGASGQRAQDAAGGLVLDTLAGEETPEQKAAKAKAIEDAKKPAAIDTNGIYAARAAAMKPARA